MPDIPSAPLAPEKITIPIPKSNSEPKTTPPSIEKTQKTADEKDNAEAAVEAIAKKVAASCLRIIGLCYCLAAFAAFTVGALGIYSRYFRSIGQISKLDIPEILLAFLGAIALFLPAISFSALSKIIREKKKLPKGK
jgi:hypothetical protein